jgi:hypothetical protein
MNITDLTPQQLRRAASIKEKLDGLDQELRRLFEWIVIQWSAIREEAHHERRGEKKDCHRTAGEMG